MARAGGVLLLTALFFVVGCSNGSDDTSGSAGDGRIPYDRTINDINALQAALLFDGITDIVVVNDIKWTNTGYTSKLVNIPAGKTVTLTKDAKFTEVVVIVRPGAKLYIEEAGQVWNEKSKIIIRPNAVLAGVTNFFEGISGTAGSEVIIFPGANVQKGNVKAVARAVIGELENAGTLLTVEGNDLAYLALGPSGSFNIGTPSGGGWGSVEDGNPTGEGEGGFDHTLYSYNAARVAPPSKITISDSIVLGEINDLSVPANANYSAPEAGSIVVRAPQDARVVFQDMTLTFVDATTSPFPAWLDNDSGNAPLFIKDPTFIGDYSQAAVGKAVFGSIKRKVGDNTPLNIEGELKLGGELMPTVAALPINLLEAGKNAKLTILKDSYFAGDSNANTLTTAGQLTFTTDFSFTATSPYAAAPVALTKTATGITISLGGSGILNGNLKASYLASADAAQVVGYAGFDVAEYTFTNVAYTKNAVTDGSGLEITLDNQVLYDGTTQGEFRIQPRATDTISTFADGASLRYAAGANSVSMKGVQVAVQDAASSAFYIDATPGDDTVDIKLVLTADREAIQFVSGGELAVQGVPIDAGAVQIVKPVTFTAETGILPTSPATLTATELGLYVPAKVVFNASGNNPIAIENAGVLKVDGKLTLNGRYTFTHGIVDVSGGALAFEGAETTLFQLGNGLIGSAALKIKGLHNTGTVNFAGTGGGGISWGAAKPRIEMIASSTATAGGISELQVGNDIYTVQSLGTVGTDVDITKVVIEDGALKLQKNAHLKFASATGTDLVTTAVNPDVTAQLTFGDVTVDVVNPTTKQTVQFGPVTLSEGAHLDLKEAVGNGTARVMLGAIRADLTAGTTAATGATVANANGTPGVGVPKITFSPVRAGFKVGDLQKTQTTGGFWGSAGEVLVAAGFSLNATDTKNVMRASAAKFASATAFPNNTGLADVWYWVQGYAPFADTGNAGWVAAKGSRQ